METPWITSRAELVELRDRLNLRPDFHEPDEAGIDAKMVKGRHGFDNAFMDEVEHHIVLIDLDNGAEPVAKINLAALLALAAGAKEVG